MSEGPLFAAGAAEGPARRALALGVRSEVSQRERDELASLLDLADAGFYELARSHVLGPVVFSRLNELQMLDLLDEKTATRLKRDYGVAAMRATSLASDLADVLRALERSGVAPAPIKGAALAWDLYPEPGCRPMSDFDLLVAPEEAGRACDSLLGMGYAVSSTDPALTGFYRRHFHLAPLVKEGATAVEIHVGTAAAPEGDAAAACLSRASEGRLLNFRVRRLEAADQLAVVAGHAFSHRAPSLLAMADVERLCRRVASWDGFAERIAPAYRPAVGAALALSAEILGAPVGEGVARELVATGGPGALDLVRSAPEELWSRRAGGLALLGTTARGWRGLFPPAGQTVLTFGVDSRSWSFPFYRAAHPLRQALVGLRSLMSRF